MSGTGFDCLALLAAVGLGLSCLAPAPAAAQFFSCDRYESPADRARCREATGQHYPPQGQPPAAPQRGQGQPDQRRSHEDAVVMSGRTQRALLPCLRGSDDAKRLECYDRAMESWRQDMVEAGLIPRAGPAR